MMNTCFGFLGLSVWTIVIVVATAVAGYLFLRANPRKKAKLDKAVDKVKDVLDNNK